MPAMAEVTHWVLVLPFSFSFLHRRTATRSLFVDSLESQRFLHRLCIVYVYHFFPYGRRHDIYTGARWSPCDMYMGLSPYFYYPQVLYTSLWTCHA